MQATTNLLDFFFFLGTLLSHDRKCMLSSLPFKAMAGARAAVPDPTGVFSVLVHTFSWWNGDSLKFAKTALEITSTLNQFPAEI